MSEKKVKASRMLENGYLWALVRYGLTKRWGQVIDTDEALEPETRLWAAH